MRPTRLTAPLGTVLRAVTGLGWAVLVLGAGSLLVGVRLNWQEFTQVGTVAVVLVLLGLVWVLVPGRPSAELVLQPARVTEGRPAAALLRVRNGSVPLLHPVLDVPLGGSRGVSVRLPVLAPFARHEELVALPERPRGAWTVGPVAYRKSDLLGLAARHLACSGRVTLLVRPRVVRLELLSSGATTDLEGTTSQQLTMSDLAFHALREYRPGDDLRQVHWRSSAKADQLLVRQYHETRRGHVTVLVDHEQPVWPRRDDFELAVSIAASVALRAVGDGLDVLLRCGPDQVAARGPEQVLDTACRFRRQAGGYPAAAAAASAAAPGTGLVVQVTGPGRPTAELRSVATRFNPDATRLILRSDVRGQVRVGDFQGSREIVVPDLAALPALLARSLR